MTSKHPTPVTGDETIESAFVRIVKPDKTLAKDLENLTINETSPRAEHIEKGVKTLQNFISTESLGYLTSLAIFTISLAVFCCLIVWYNTAS